MKRVLCCAILIHLLLTISAGAYAAGQTAGETLAGMSDSQLALFSGGVLTGYVLGRDDTVRHFIALNESNSEGASQAYQLALLGCMENMTQTQLAEIVRTHLRSTPEDWGRPAGEQVLSAANTLCRSKI
jgi:hypothetical protein